MNKIVGIIMAVILIIGSLPFLSVSVKIEWTVYLGIPLIIMIGFAGVTFITKRIEAIIAGMIISVLFPVLLKLLGSTLGSL